MLNRDFPRCRGRRLGYLSKKCPAMLIQLSISRSNSIWTCVGQVLQRSPQLQRRRRQTAAQRIDSNTVFESKYKKPTFGFNCHYVSIIVVLHN